MMRVGMITRVRLVFDAIASALAQRSPAVEIVRMASLAELHAHVKTGRALDLVIVDTIKPVDLEEFRGFHGEFPQLPLLAFGLREREAEVLSHGSAGFSCYLRREDGIESLCRAIEDALHGRLTCSPEIAAAMMRALFRRRPAPSPDAVAALTRREEEVAALLAQAYSNKEIARALGLSESTVKHHVHAVLGKFRVQTRGQLMRGFADRPGPAQHNRAAGAG